ncbi:hypothetical protein LSH36_84g09013 [Paralvinella palmiformis]|uniref:Uncharacterized protein n=1 Tax=Paralvinella palmiformis TaxID=53620 RepID=A0AAD9K3D6_9ANNE|nr:hypothetical protein LSH36_84g09013 [Paralvinella palmiformis]
MVIKLYVSRTSGNVLETLKLSDDEMVALPPQIFKGQSYRGDYNTFLQAVESEHLFKYLDMEVPTDEVEYQRKHEAKA